MVVVVVAAEEAAVGGGDAGNGTAAAAVVEGVGSVLLLGVDIGPSQVRHLCGTPSHAATLNSDGTGNGYVSMCGKGAALLGPKPTGLTYCTHSITVLQNSKL